MKLITNELRLEEIKLISSLVNKLFSKIGFQFISNN